MSALARFKSLRRRIQRRRYRAPVLLGDENGEIDVGLGAVWVRFEAGTDENGNTTFAPATVVNAGSANYAVYAGARLWVGYDENDELTILNPDNRDLRNAGIASQILNSARPENAFVYLRNVWRLLSRPTGGPIEPATTVYVNPLVYDDNYGDFNVYTGTPKAANKVDLSSFIPSTGNHRIAVLFLDTVTDTIQTVASTTQSMSADIDATDYQECFDQRNAETIPIQAYLLQNDASSIDARDLTEDLRQFVNVPPVLGIANPMDKEWILRAGQKLVLHSGHEFTAGFEVLGELEIIDEPVVTTYSGHMYQDDTGTVVTIVSTNTDVIVDGYSLRSTRNMEWQNTQEFKIVKAGEYEIEWQLAFTMAAGSNQEIEGAIGINGTRDVASSSHRKIGTGTDTGSMSGLDTVILAEDDLVQLVVRNETSTNNVVVQHSQVRIKKTDTKVG